MQTARLKLSKKSKCKECRNYLLTLLTSQEVILFKPLRERAQNKILIGFPKQMEG